MTNVARYIQQKWNQYKYRFTPWIALTLKKRSVRSVQNTKLDNIIPDREVESRLGSLFQIWIDDRNALIKENRPSFQNESSMKTGRLNLDSMYDHLGFTVELGRSKVAGGGTGVVIGKGTVQAQQVVALYPGAIYLPGDPILLQSIANQFVFRCIDGLFIDGNNRGISKFMFKSCAQRDRHGPYMTCDMSWLTPHLDNPLAIGQFVNNQNKEFPANVAYQEVDLSIDFPFSCRQFVPNIFYSPDTGIRPIRVIVLVSVRKIEEREELISNYFTVVN